VTEPSPSQDPGGQAQTPAKIRNAGGVIVFSVMAVLGVVGLAAGHAASGLVALVIGAPMLIVIIARLAGHGQPGRRPGQPDSPAKR
jgi:hypothetical protein